MKESKDRTEQFMYSASTSASSTSGSSAYLIPLRLSPRFSYATGSLLYQSHRADPMGDGSASRFDSKGKGRAHHNGDLLALDLDAAEEGLGGHNGGAFQQMQLVEQQVRTSYSTCLRSTITSFAGLVHPATVYRDRIHRVDYR